MNKELKNPSHIAKLPKFGHDMGQIFKFSSCVGHLLPVYYDDLQPGDKVRFSTDMFTQMTDIVGPAMLDLEEFVEWFFVPYEQLYQFAGDNYYSINDSHTSYRANLGDTSVFPMIEKNLLYYFDTGDFNNGYLLGDILANELESELQDAFGSFYPNTFNTNYDMFGVPLIYNAIRLFDLLGFGDGYLSKSGELVVNDTFNPRFLLAYQKIYYDHYRITDRENNDVKAYNVDDLSNIVGQTDQGRTDKWKKLHYRPWKKDFFTSMLPSPLVEVGEFGMANDRVDNRLTHFNNWLSQGETANENLTSIVGNANGFMNTALLRGMFAVEKLMEITRRAAKRYDAQVLAHLGFNIPDGISNEVYRLGSDKNQIYFNEVIATAAGSGAGTTTTLGEKGGKGAGFSKGKTKSFVAPCHGILMAIYSASPKADYSTQQTDRLNTFATRYDFWQPEFDRLGMQPLFRYQLCSWDFNDDSDNLGIIGWQWRYMEQKMKINRAGGAFLYNEPYKHWTVLRDVTLFKNYISSQSELSLPFFYVPISAIDNILLLHSQPSPFDILNYQYGVYARDSMLHWFKFNVTKSSRMSTYSLPSL